MVFQGLIFLKEALVHDAAGREALAIPLYRAAMKKGLSKGDLRDAMICLGSSLRTVGEVKGAIRVLRRARKLYPRDPVVILFLALAHASDGQQLLAIRQLADCVLKESRSPELEPYRKVLARKFHGLRL